MINPTRQSVVIFDLDGCVSDDRARRPYLPTKHDGVAPGFEFNSYHEYHKNMELDKILQFSLKAIRAAHMANMPIVFLTARPNDYHEQTFNWIRQNVYVKGGDVTWSLIMRPKDDLRGSVEFKREKIRNVLSMGPVAAAFDDRADIVAMYREEGVQAWILDHEGINMDHIGAPELPAWLAGGLVVQNRNSLADGPARKEREQPSDAGDILLSMGKTFKERNALYKDNAVLVGKLMETMFPNGVTLNSAADFHMWHLFELKIVKLTRFVNSGLKHEDSIHDDAIYSAMCERLVGTHDIKVN